MRDWLKSLDEIDRDCVYHYEYLLGRKLKGYEEYHEIDMLVDEMILEWDNREEFFTAYPALQQYRKQSPKRETVHLEAQNKKHERFVRVAAQRTQKVLDDLRSLSKCAALESYAYKEKDLEQIFSSIERELQVTKDTFAGVKKFSLDASHPSMKSSSQVDTKISLSSQIQSAFARTSDPVQASGVKGKVPEYDR